MSQTRKRPAPPQNRPSSNATRGYRQSTAEPILYGFDRLESLTADDRADLAVISAAAERGYRIAVQCRRCGAWVTNPKSVRRFLGPVCAAKAVNK
ncbi:Uncharacterised protein [Mycolicibacterium flavescens]|uniref:DUF6011 domain-containing protein n=1 Tax=Mycobacterium neumannii TaxID=2048551 RepID=UPI000F6FF944|nr:Uncharacterised protein [Mycolicibacterium flavescens]